ncbi:phosphatase PAP2 family protein [Companilactobacillus nantensis]|uniref:phosphatase PAP2 family protein n=1 Tax=Companilactobacillus nantensis TaxID=305793 RepID=UPI00070DB082|nr:phosphatase PAP2 family protein [Companilactobacillus nantensis]GEO65087.1 phosphatase PAP2 family protein [Companilactobacillus nantensis]
MKISKKLFILTISLLIIFGFWTINVALQTNLIKSFDTTLINQIYHHNNFSLSIFRPLTNIGDTFETILVTAIIFLLLIVKKYYYAAIYLVLNKVIVAGLNSLVKIIIERPRPSHTHYVYAGGFSFPSGHSASSFALYISILIISLYIFKNLKSKIIISTLCVLMVILIGYSRIFLGVHYPSDVLGGYLLAATILTFNTLLFRTKNLSILQFKGVKN